MQVLVKAVLVDQLIINDKSRNECIEQRDKLRKADSIYVKSKDKKKKRVFIFWVIRVNFDKM